MQETEQKLWQVLSHAQEEVVGWAEPDEQPQQDVDGDQQLDAEQSEKMSED